jgi:hypothetical protein
MKYGGTSRILLAGLILACLIFAPAAQMPSLRAQQSTEKNASSQNSASGPAQNPNSLPRGKKLIFKDGNFQMVREYEINGDRVRYYSIDSQQWDEVPAEFVDWEAMKKAASEDAKRDATWVAQAHKQEAGRRAEALDIDASLEAAPGVFLPPGQGLFVYDGKGILPLAQSETQSKMDKRHMIEQVLIPIPIVPTRHNLTIVGARAKTRIKTAQPEFYLRLESSMEPNVELIRAKVQGNSRLIENLDELYKEQQIVADEVPVERWEAAKGVFRFTIGQSLVPGEYAMVQVIKGETISIVVWDFGVDEASAQAAKPQ